MTIALKPYEDFATWVALRVSCNQQTDKGTKGSDSNTFNASLSYLWQLFANTSSFSACVVPFWWH